MRPAVDDDVASVDTQAAGVAVHVKFLFGKYTAML